MKRTIFVLLIILANLPLIAQPPHWKAGLNTGAGVDAVTAGNNTFETIPALPIRIFTGNTHKATFTQGSPLGPGIIPYMRLVMD